MEDSEQRKKRLKEMREQADLAEGSGGVEDPEMPGALSNPLVEVPLTMLSNAAPRFNYYTDPMNAFSSEKRNNPNVHAPPDYFPPPNFSRPPMEQISSTRPELTNQQMSPSPNQVLPTAYGNPVWNGPRGPAHHNFPFRPAGGGTYPSPRFEPPRGPSYNSAHGMNQWPNHSPNMNQWSNHSPNMNQWPNHSPNMNQWPNHNPNMNQWPNHSPNPSPGYRNSPGPNQGRGRGFWNNTRSPDSGRGRGQGSSSRGRWSNDDRACVPDRFYKRSMVEDPWKSLEPVIWNVSRGYSNTAHTPGNSKPRTLSKSTSTQREESSTVFVKPNSGPSLAEYLASALDEAANNEENG